MKCPVLGSTLFNDVLHDICDIFLGELHPSPHQQHGVPDTPTSQVGKSNISQLQYATLCASYVTGCLAIGRPFINHSMIHR